MKKFLLSCMCLLGLATASATTTTWVASAQGYTNGQELTEVSIDNGAVTITLDKGTNNNTPKYFNTGSAIRLYGGNTMTFTAKEGVAISSVVFTTTSSNMMVEGSSVDAGSIEGLATTTTTWTGNTNEFTFTEGGTTGHARITKIEITYSEGGAVVVMTPRFNPAAGEVKAGTPVEITSATPGAEIHYTVDGTEPTPNSTLYTAPIAVNEAMTIKAVAVLDGNMSDVAVAEYTIKPQAAEVANIAAWLDAKNADEFLAIANPVTAVYQNGSNLYVKDNSGWLLIFGNVGKTYNNGDQIAAGLAGKYKDYNGLPEMTPDADTFEAGVAGTPVEPTPIYTIDDIEAEPLSSYIELQDVTLGAASGKSIPVTDVNGSNINLYNTFNIQIPEGEGYNVRGFISIYNGTYQITPVEAYIPGVVPTVETPTFSVAAGEVLAGTSVAISCATEGATIYYTVNGGDPTEANAVYTEPIVINEATVLKAVAMKEGMNNSEVAVAEYTIYTPTEGEVVTYFVAPGYDASNLVGNVVVLNNNGGNNEPSTSDDAKEEGKSLNGTTFSSDNVEIVFSHGDGSYYATAYNTEVRFYQGETMTVTPKANNRVVKMYFNTVANSKGGVKVTVNGETTGVVEGTGVGASNPITWVGEFTTAADVTALKQVRFNYLRIETASTTGIENVGIEADENAPVEFYNLQGVRVANPANGLYIRVQGKTATKVLVK